MGNKYPLDAMVKRLSALQDRLKEKLPEGLRADVEMTLNYTDSCPIYFKVYTNLIHLPEGWPGDFPCKIEDEAYAHLLKWERYIATMPTRDEVAKKNAAKNLGRAIDMARDAGLDVDRIAVSFQSIWENLLEDFTPPSADASADASADTSSEADMNEPVEPVEPLVTKTPFIVKSIWEE
jgi:hypothetical protein